MNTKITVLFAFLLVGLASACGLGSGGATETRNDTFVVGDAPRVIVTGDNGRVIVISGPVRTVSVDATLRKPNKIEYEVAQEGDMIRVTAKTSGTIGQGEASLLVRSSNGSIKIR